MIQDVRGGEREKRRRGEASEEKRRTSTGGGNHEIPAGARLKDGRTRALQLFLPDVFAGILGKTRYEWSSRQGSTNLVQPQMEAFYEINSTRHGADMDSGPTPDAHDFF